MFISFYHTPVERFRGNGFALYDVLVKVMEWIYFTYEFHIGANEKGCDEPLKITAREIYKVVRGGSWRFGPARVRAANRSSAAPRARFDDVGFRVASDL